MPAVGFTHPLLLVLLAALPAFYVLAQRGRRARLLPRGLWRFAFVLRLLIALLLVLALAGLRLPAPARSVATVFVLDLSESVPLDIQEGAKNWIREALRRAGPDDQAAIVTFGREARIERPLGAARDHVQWGEPPPADGSDIAAALRLAADLLPPPNSGPLRRIVLLSDGVETQGDAYRTLLRPHLRGVEIAAQALPQRLQDTAITGLAAPAALREGEPADLRVSIHSPTSQEATLRVWANEHLIAEQTIALESGPKEVPVSTGGLAQGFWSFRATLEVASDSRPQNNEHWAYSVVGDPARVLVVEGTPGEAAAVRETLAAARIQVETISPAQLPTDPARLDDYQTVVLANVPATAMRQNQMLALQRYVGEYGGGLVVIGGEHTFGLGEYAETPLEETLPVTVRPPDDEQVASLALVLVIDRSGSMSATDTADRRTSRMELAKEGAIQAVETLKEGDQVGVIAFDYSAVWITSIQTIRGPADIRSVADRIATIRPEGGTEFFNALEMAYRGLQQTPARVKHVIMLTDGEAPETGIPQLLAAMRRAGITVSTVGVSSDISGTGRGVLERIARAGQGRFYFTNTANDVPRIMTQEARLAGQNYKQERDFTPRVVTAAPAVRGLVPAELPQLHGYVRVSPRSTAETVLTSDIGELVLGQWQYGLGRALVWTADAQGAWSRDWAGTEAFKRFWPQAVRWTMPAPADSGLRASVSVDGSQATIRVDAFDPIGEFRNLLPTSADVAFPDGTGRRIVLAQVAPGRYEGQFSLSSPGVYPIQITQRDGAGALVASTTTGYAYGYPPEYQVSAANRALLERLVADTGGPRLDRPQDSWRRDTAHAWQPQDVWDTLLMAALVLFVADVALRRLRPSAADVQVIRVAVRRTVGTARGAVRAGVQNLPRIELHPLQGGRRRS